MAEITLRPVAPQDLPAIAAIYADAVTHGTSSYELVPPTEAEMAARMAAILAEGYPYIVATDGDRLVGYAYASAFRTRPAYRFIVENSVYLDPAMQGRGFGRLLLARLIELTAARGYRQMIAVIGDGSERNASVKLHRSLGFVLSGTIVGSGYKHGRWLDTMIMQLALNGGTGTEPDPASWPERRHRGEA